MKSGIRINISISTFLVIYFIIKSITKMSKKVLTLFFSDGIIWLSINGGNYE